MKKTTRLVVIAPGEPAEFFDPLWGGVCSAADEISPLGVNVTKMRSPCHDVEWQKRVLIKLLEVRPDAIAMIPAHASLLNSLIDQHVSRGTAVVTFNADAPDSNRSSFVGPDARKAGALAAEVLAKMLRGKGEILAFPGTLETQHLAGRYEGFLGELRRWSPGIFERACYPGVAGLRDAASRLLDKHPEAAGIYVGNSRAWEIASVMEARGLRLACVGFDNTVAVRPFLARNTVNAVIDENAHQQGYVAVQRAYEATISSRESISRWTLIPSTVVFSTNSTDGSESDSLNEAFELLVRQRTTKLRFYQEMLQEANTELQRLADTDALTGLLNRRRFQKILEDTIVSSSVVEPLSLLMIDLDEFKGYNDRFGHLIGDEALKTVARILHGSVDSSHFCARLGGDEFCVIMPNTAASAAETVKHRIQRAVNEAVVVQENLDLRLRVSVGLASCPFDGATAEALVAAADRAMYLEKRCRHEAPSPVSLHQAGSNCLSGLTVTR